MIETLEDLKGQKIGKLRVLGKCANARKTTKWVCICDCGNYCVVSEYKLKKDITKSCGCLHILEKDKRIFNVLPETKKRINTIWASMKQRCNNAKNKDYKNYGGRGIKICEDWHYFSDFLYWSINNGYAKDLCLDRINCNGNYEPNNCRWVTQKIQQNNKRNNHLLTFNNKTQNIEAWANELNIHRSIIDNRLHCGWSVEKIFNTPVRKRKV